MKAIILVALTVFGYTQAACFGNCGLGPGEDVCCNKCQPMVVRPQAIPKPPAPTMTIPAPPIKVPLPLTPVGGPCFCKRPIVKPAVLPKPICNPGGCYQRRIATSKNCASNYQTNHEVVETFGPGNVVVNGALLEAPVASPFPCGGYQQNREQLAPADPVSVSIAYELAKKAQNLKEDVLSFGFRQLPKEVPVQMKKTNNIPEENLYSLNGAIVELKPVMATGKSIDEEAAEQLIELQEEDAVNAEQNVRKLSLGELGYGLAKIEPSAQYINVPPVPIQPCQCKDPNYIPGSVIINKIPKAEPIALPAPYPEPCPPEPNCNYGVYDAYASKSTQSCQSCKQSQNMYYRKSGCGCGF